MKFIRMSTKKFLFLRSLLGTSYFLSHFFKGCDLSGTNNFASAKWRFLLQVGELAIQRAQPIPRAEAT